jgi:hypothetical protein
MRMGSVWLSVDPWKAYSKVCWGVPVSGAAGRLSVGLAVYETSRFGGV